MNAVLPLHRFSLPVPDFDTRRHPFCRHCLRIQRADSPRVSRRRRGRHDPAKISSGCHPEQQLQTLNVITILRVAPTDVDGCTSSSSRRTTKPVLAARSAAAVSSFHLHPKAFDAVTLPFHLSPGRVQARSSLLRPVRLILDVKINFFVFKRSATKTASEMTYTIGTLN